MTKPKGKIDYSYRMRAIRPYVDFNYDLRRPLSSAAKAKITRYYEYIQKLTVRPHQVYRSSNDKNLKAVQRFSQHDTKHPALKVAFVPNAGVERMSLTVTKDGKVRGKTGNIRVYEIPLDVELIAGLVAEDQEQDDPEVNSVREYLQEIIDTGPEVQRYVIQAGEFEFPGAFAKQFIVDEMLRVMNNYSADKFNPEKKSSHYFGNWMHGLNGYRFRNQAELGEYREAKRQMAKKAARNYVRQNRKEKRIRERPPGFWIDDSAREVKRDREPQPVNWRETTAREYYIAIGKGYREIKTRASREIKGE